MNSKMTSVLITIGIFISIAFTSQNNNRCNVEEALKACNRALKPYTFQDRKTITFKYEDNAQVKEYEAQLFKGEKYRIVFNSTYSPGVEFKVFDGPESKSNRKLLFHSKNEKQGNLFIFHPETIPHIYIDLIIPAGNNKFTEGCSTILIGYELTF